MRKSYVIDTNVILFDAEAIYKFEEHNVIIPFGVVEEIDTFKKEQNELGRNARAFSRYIDDLRTKGKLTEGINLNDKEGKLFVILFDQTVGNCLPYQDMSIIDNRILATAVYARTFLRLVTHDEVILVTLDTNLRIKADAHGIRAEDYKNGKVVNDDLYTGINQLDVPQFVIDQIYDNKFITVSSQTEWILNEPFMNECYILKSGQQSALVRYTEKGKFKLLPQNQKTVDIIPRNTEQQFALDILKDTSINLVSLVGKAGSGKTLLALASAIHHVLETHHYNKILLLKPIVSMDNAHELGFLPGSMEEKLSPWMASYADNIELIMSAYFKEDESTTRKPRKGATQKPSNTTQEKQAGKTNPIHELMELGILEFGSLEHIRGRSLPNQFILIDEAQNLTIHALKTLITRVGEGTKIVLLGDISQIDSPYLDSRSNGLSIVVEAMKKQSIAAHITLKKSERSKLAEIAAEIL